MGHSTSELVALHLWEQEPTAPVDVGAPYEVSIPGISDALDFGDSLSERIQLLSTLASMKEEGLLVEDRAHVEGLHGERNVYSTTDEGRHLARDVYDRIEGETIHVVHDGITDDVRLDVVDDDLPDVTIAGALARTTDDDVLHLRDEHTPPAGIINRQTELDSLVTCLEAVSSGATETLLVSGESGIGKTTLVEHALEDARDRGFVVLTGTATEDVTEPYLPIRTALSDHRETAPARLFEAGASAVEATDGTDLGDLADRRRSLFADVATMLSDLAATQPVALFLDDLHAADPGTLALLEYIATTLEEDRLLLVGAYRPEVIGADHPLTAVLEALDEDGRQIELAALDERSTRSLVERTLDAHDVPGEFVETIHTRTGGHPLFVEATVSQLREEGVVDPRTDHYPADPDLPLPQEVRTAIERRLDTLDDAARAVLETASVMGTTVDFRVLAVVSELPEAELREYVDLLDAARIWTRGVDDEGAADVATDGGQLAFANEVVRDAVHERIPDQKRRALHEQVAEALERVQTGDLDARAGTVARHYERAGAPEPAIEYYRRAGDNATSVYAYETAIGNYERALALAREYDQENAVLALLKLLGEVYLNADEYEEANRYFEYVLERTDDPTTHWEVAANRASLRNKRGEFDATIEVADDALDRWDGETATPEIRALIGYKVWALYRKGEVERARALAETQRELADRLDDPRERGETLATLASIERSSGNIELAIELLEEAIEVSRAGEERRLEGFCLNNLGVSYWHRDVESALEMFEHALRLHRETNSPRGEMAALGNVGECLEKIGEWDRALDRLEEALERSRTLEADQFVASNTIIIGMVYLERGALDKAREHLARGLEIAKTVQFREFVEAAHVEFARLEYRQANFQAGVAAADAVVQSDESAKTQNVPQAYAAKGRIRLAQGDLERAQAVYERGVERATATENLRGCIRNRCGLADVHRRAGRIEAANEQATTAREAAADRSNPLLVVESALARARIQRVTRPEGAEETLQTALTDARELGAAVHECEVLYELGQLHHEQCVTTDARDSLEAALVLAEETGATLFARRCEDALDELPVAGDS